MTGILYGVGVGPGDPELLTLKAVRILRENRVFALPGAKPAETAAYRIAVQAVPQIAEGELVALPFPMTEDRALLESRHRENAAVLEKILSRGENVVFLTLGDVMIYSTFCYVQKLVEADGYRTEMVSGVPSFCAAAAALHEPVAEASEMIHILPASRLSDFRWDLPGTVVLMKTGSKMREMKDELHRSGRLVYAAENCGLPEERLYYGTDAIPDEAGYFTLILAKEPEQH